MKALLDPGLFSLHLGSWKELILMTGSEPYWASPFIGQLADIFDIYGDYISYNTSNNHPSEFRRSSGVECKRGASNKDNIVKQFPIFFENQLPKGHKSVL